MRSNSTGILQSGGTFEPLQAARLYCAPYADADDQIKRHCGRYKYSSTYPSIHHASLAELAAASPLPSLVCAALQSMSRSVQATGTQQSRYAYMMQPLAPDSFPQHVLQHTCESECRRRDGALSARASPFGCPVVADSQRARMKFARNWDIFRGQVIGGAANTEQKLRLLREESAASESNATRHEKHGPYHCCVSQFPRRWIDWALRCAVSRNQRRL